MKSAFPQEFNENPPSFEFDSVNFNAGSSRIDGAIGQDIAVEIESRVSKQVRGALVDLAFHPFPKKLMVLMRKYGNAYTAPQCRVIMKRLCPACRFEVVEIEGSGDEPELHHETDVDRVTRAVQRLRDP